jgi:hypothetical protein
MTVRQGGFRFPYEVANLFEQGANVVRGADGVNGIRTFFMAYLKQQENLLLSWA